MPSPYLTNPTNSNVYPFTDITNPATVNWRALPEPINNIAAAKGLIGGSKSKKHRINNISNMYKMKGSRKSVSRRIRRIKSRLRSKYGIKSRKNHSRHAHSRKTCNKKNCSIHHMKGGHSQYMNNVPNTPSFSTGGPLSPLLSALANPVPFKLLPNNSIDNLNHNALNSFGNSGSGMGFLSKGSF
jgi:hypothetical protein